jgi:hypothetical protein
LQRYAIDDGTDFSEAQQRIKALNGAAGERRTGVSSVVSVKTPVQAEQIAPPKRKADGHDGRDKKKSKGQKHKSSRS